MKRLNVMFIFAFLGLFSTINFCSKIFPTEPEEFRKMEIHYTVTFWGATSKLDIFGDGTVQKSSLQGVLTTAQEDSLIQLFSNFSKYDPNYSPEFSNPDGSYHTLNYIDAGKSKSVTVYDPSEANIPESLQNIITYLNDLFFSSALPIAHNMEKTSISDEENSIDLTGVDFTVGLGVRL